MKVNLLRSQVERLDRSINVLINMSISTQRVVDLKNAQIQELEEQRNKRGPNGDEGKDGRNRGK